MGNRTLLASIEKRLRQLTNGCKQFPYQDIKVLCFISLCCSNQLVRKSFRHADSARSRTFWCVSADAEPMWLGRDLITVGRCPASGESEDVNDAGFPRSRERRH